MAPLCRRPAPGAALSCFRPLALGANSPAYISRLLNNLPSQALSRSDLGADPSRLQPGSSPQFPMAIDDDSGPDVLVVGGNDTTPARPPADPEAVAAHHLEALDSARAVAAATPPPVPTPGASSNKPAAAPSLSSSSAAAIAAVAPHAAYLPCFLK